MAMDPSKRLGFELNGTQLVQSASTSILPPQPPQNSPEVGNAENQSSPLVSGQDLPRACDLLMSVTVRAEANKPKIRKLATAATEELIQLASEEKALWLLDEEGGNYVLNETEYKKRFAPLDPTLAEILRMLKTEGPMEVPNFDDTFDKVFSRDKVESVTSLRSEASQETGIVFMNPLKLVHMFMDAGQWSILFCDIVAKAKVLEVLSMAKQGNFDGALQVMTAEFHVPSPLVQTRESYFLRHCSRLPSNTWVVVDVSLESIFPNPAVTFLRKPSGCVIQGMEDGYSKVKWIEHVEVDNKTVHHLFKPLVTSGFAFSAKRWIGTLTRQCDRVAAYVDEHVMTMKDGKRCLLKLADRMTRNFQAGISASAENIWKPIPAAGAEDILVTTSSSMDDPATPHGVCVTVATTIWLPSHPKRVFEFLRNGEHRNKWDLLSLKSDTREILRIASSREPANSVSVIGISTSQQIFYLQESQMNSTGSYIVYAPIDKFTLHPVLSGEKESPDDIQILSSGFAVLPDRAPTMQQQEVGEEICGSLLTIAFQIVDTYSSSPEYLPPKSVITLYTIIAETASRIRNAMIQ